MHTLVLCPLFVCRYHWHLCGVAGEEIARQIADVADYVYHSARTWGSQLSEPLTRPNLQRVPLLTSLGSDSSAEFSDGLVTENVDAVVYCTGYKYKYPFLEGTGLISTGDHFQCQHRIAS